MALRPHRRVPARLVRVFKLFFICAAACSLFAPVAPSQSNEKGSRADGQEADQSKSPKAADPNQQSSQDQEEAEITAVPNRPTFSTTAETVQRGVLEIEYGFEAADGHQNINGLIKFGLTKNIELRFANNIFERDAGIGGVG